MRQPRPHDFDPKYRERSLEAIDMDGIVPIRSKPTPVPEVDTTIYTKKQSTPAPLTTPTPLPPSPVVSPPAPVTPEAPELSVSTSEPVSQELSTSNGAIVALSDTQVSALRESAFKAQTFRFTERELDWLKEQSYQMSKELRRGKVSQVDIIRVGMQLFANAQAVDKASLLDILHRIK